MDSQLIERLQCEDARESSIQPEFLLYRSQEFNCKSGEGISFTITTEKTGNRLEYFLHPVYYGKAAKATLSTNHYNWHDESFQRILVCRINTRTGNQRWFNQSHPLFTLSYISKSTGQPIRPLLFYSVVKASVVKFSKTQEKLTADNPVLPDYESLILGVEKPSIHNRQPSSHRRHCQKQADKHRARVQQNRLAKVSIR